MGTVEPIRNLEDLKKIEKILSKNKRNLLFFTIGTNCGLRISDILALNVGDVKNRNYIQIIEKKTGKFKKIPINTKLKPNNYSIIKNDIAKEKNLLEVIYYTEEERENIYLEFVSTFLDCFEEKIQQIEKEEIIEWIYRFRYFLLLPFNKEQSIKNIDEVHDKILEIEKELMKICKKNKIIKNDVPLEVWTHIFETRIIELENICYKIFTEYDKKYVQLFDENISEEKYIINNIEKNKINKKMKIFL